MKKTLLFLLLAIMTHYARAVEFNELDLLGSWELSSCVGEYPGFTTNPYGDYPDDYSFITPGKGKYLYFGTVDNSVKLPGTTGNFHDGTVIAGGMFYPENTNLTAPAEWDYDDYENMFEIGMPIANFSISNQNKLHIDCYAGWGYRFIIESLTADEMKLKSYDGKCTVAYKRSADSSKVKGVNASEDTEEEYYTLDGNRINHPQKGVNIIRHKGKSHKELK